MIVLVLYRKWITATISSLAGRIKNFKAGPSGIEAELWESTVDATGRNIAGALSQVPEPASSKSIPTSLVDLIDDVNKDPRVGIRTAFYLVRRALNEFYPQLASVAPHKLPLVTKDLVREGALDPDVEWALTRLYQLMEVSDSNAEEVSRGHGYEFLMLAEGAIHGILRTAAPRDGTGDGSPPGRRSPPIQASWSGVYNDDYRIELRIENWRDGNFEGLMVYPGWGAGTNIVGSVANKATDDGSAIVTWQEVSTRFKGTHSPELNGRYQAEAFGNTMSGGWYSGDRLVARFALETVHDGARQI